MGLSRWDADAATDEPVARRPDGRERLLGAVAPLEYVVAAICDAAQSHPGRIVHERRDLRLVRTNPRRSAGVECSKKDSGRWRLVSTGGRRRAWQWFGQTDGEPWAISRDRPLHLVHRVQVDAAPEPPGYSYSSVSTRNGLIGSPFHHCFSGPSRKIAKCRCGASGDALPVLPT